MEKAKWHWAEGSVLICTRRVAQIATFDYYLSHILQLTGNQTLCSVIFPADGQKRQRNRQHRNQSSEEPQSTTEI